MTSVHAAMSDPQETAACSHVCTCAGASGWTEDIGDLEGYVRATSVMLFFLSKKYFGSRNCLREVRASLEQEKPLVLVHEQQEDKGGGPLERSPYLPQAVP